MANPWFKLFPKDWLGATAELTLEEQGAYMRVLARIHEQGHSLIDDDRKIARTVGVNTRRWKRIRLGLIEAGKLIAYDGLLINLRASRDLDEFDPSFLKKLAKNSQKIAIKWPKGSAQAAETIEPAAPKPEARRQKPEATTRLGAGFKKDLLAALGKAEDAGGVNFKPVEQWLAQGVPRTLIVSVIRTRVAARRRAGRPPPKTFQYFNDAIAEAVTAHDAQTDIQDLPGNPPGKSSGSAAERFARLAAELSEFPDAADGEPGPG